MKISRLDHLVAALPDSLTALYFLSVWINPAWLGIHGVRNGMLIMLVEFILVHASGFLGARMFAEDTSRRKKLASLIAFGAFYLVFIAAWACTFRQWWPFLAFGWLLAGKFTRLAGFAVNDAGVKRRMQSDWTLGVMAYLLGVFVTILLPMPHFGITPEVVSSLDLPGSGEWVREPHRVIAFGLIYFSSLAWLKWKDYQLPATGTTDVRSG